MPWKSLTTEDTEIQRIAQRRSRIEKDLSQKVLEIQKSTTCLRKRNPGFQRINHRGTADTKKAKKRVQIRTGTTGRLT
jgi:hypothetical protein